LAPSGGGFGEALVVFLVLALAKLWRFRKKHARLSSGRANHRRGEGLVVSVLALVKLWRFRKKHARLSSGRAEVAPNIGWFRKEMVQ